MSDLPDLTASQQDRVLVVYNEILLTASGRRRDLEALRKEIIQRFGEIGIIVRVVARTETESRDPLHGFEIEITGLLDDQPTDHDLMQWEVQHGMHGGGEGTITESGLIRSPRRVF